MTSRSRSFVLFALVALATMLTLSPAAQAAPLTGSIFTTDSTCSGVDLNIYASKDAVYLDGGPQGGGPGLPDGSYYVKVTDPSGTPVLGTTVGASVQVLNGEFAQCYQLSAILIKTSDSTPGYDTTPNGGGEYKVWVSPTADFAQQKTDNFKVRAVDCAPNCPPPPRETGSILACKYYDLNTDGIDNGALEVGIAGWPITLTLTDLTPVASGTTVLGGNGRACVQFNDLLPGAYTVSEGTPVETNWIHTTNPVLPNTLVEADLTTDVDFGNVCLGAGGGLTLGYWSNKNGEATMKDGGTLEPELLLLRTLNLRNASGADFDPTTYAQFRTWILGATATNMAYMLSAQLAAMELNVEAGNVSGSALVYAPGTPCANAAGFCTVTALMTAADSALGSCGSCLILDGNPARSSFEAMKNALDKANNNLTFVQATPCAFTFPQ